MSTTPLLRSLLSLRLTACAQSVSLVLFLLLSPPVYSITGTAPVVRKKIDKSYSSSPITESLEYSNHASDTLDDQYLIGVDIDSDITSSPDGIDVVSSGVLLTMDQYIELTNGHANSGGIGLSIGRARVGALNGNISVTAQSEVYALLISSEDLLPIQNEDNETLNTSLAQVTGDLTVEALNGDATAISVETGSIGDVRGSTISVSGKNSAASAQVSGIILGRGADTSSVSSSGDAGSAYVATINEISDVTLHVTGNVSGNTGASVVGIELQKDTFIKSISNTTINLTNNSSSGASTALALADGASIGEIRNVTVHSTAYGGKNSIMTAIFEEGEFSSPISGNFLMYNRDSGSQGLSNISIGYILGTPPRTTSVTIGFLNNSTNASLKNTSMGFLIDWNNTSLRVGRDSGLSAGVIIIDNPLPLLKSTVLGSENVIESTSGKGIAVATWLNGSDLSEGALLGTLRAEATEGSAIALATVGSGLIASWMINQSRADTSINNIGGHISATVEAYSNDNIGGNSNTNIGTKAIGVQLGNTDVAVDYTGQLEDYNTTMHGHFSGEIEASMNGVDNLAEYKSNAQNLVAGIVSYGGSTLSFDGSTGAELKLGADGVAQVGIDDELGTSVSAHIYSDAGSTVTAYGHAIITLEEALRITSNSTDSSNATRFVGNLTAAATASHSANKQIAFEEGYYQIESQLWLAEDSIQVGRAAQSPEGLHQTARIELTDIASSVGETTTLATSKLEFYTNSIDDSSQIKVEMGHELNFEGLKVVNIYLQGDESDYASNLYFVDATEAGDFDADNAGITYNIYFNDAAVAHQQHESFKIIHDDSGIYLSIPEPSSVSLSLLSLVTLLLHRRRAR